MLLTFSKDSFVESIKDGTKKHTIRKDNSNRWKQGNSIQFWKGNPRNVSKNPYKFGVGACIACHPIIINPTENTVKIKTKHPDNGSDVMVVIDSEKELHSLAVNDGFENWSKMKDWFGTEEFKGVIIFWDLSKCKFN